MRAKLINRSQSRTYFLFAGLNLVWIPIVYLCKSSDIEENRTNKSYTKSIQKPVTALLNRSKPCSRHRIHFTGRWNRRTNCMVMFWQNMESARMRLLTLVSKDRFPLRSQRRRPLYNTDHSRVTQRRLENGHQR